MSEDPEPPAPTMIPADLSLHTPYMLVLRYNITNYTTTLWINPTHEADTGLRADNPSPEGVMSHSVGHFGFKQVASYEAKAHGMGSLYVDNLRLGQTFHEVAPEPFITSVTRDANGIVNVNALGIPNAIYSVLASASLHAPDWTILGNATAKAGGDFHFVDNTAPGLPMRFYRLLTTP